jgi:hypothetical protein
VRLLRLSEMPWGSLHHLLAPALMRAGSSLERVVLSEPEDDAYRRLRDRLMYLWRGYPISAPWWWS